MENTVIYHRADFDGIFCREIARKFLPENTEFIGWDYGDPLIPFPAEGKVYVLDLSPECFSGDVISEINGELVSRYARMVWIDHHKSAIEKFSKKAYGYRIDGVAACRLAWAWFTGNHNDPTVNEFDWVLPTKEQFVNREVSEPLAVRLAGEYDIWDKRDPDAETFQFGLRSRDLTDAEWKILLSIDRDSLTPCLILDGRMLQRYQREQDASVVKRAFEVKWEGLTFLALNTARCNSLTFESAAQPIHDGLMGFYFDGQKYRVSLYHSPHHKEHDLSLIAVKYGGGGHRGACGFIVDKLPFL